MITATTLVGGGVVAALLYWLLKPDPPPRAGVYLMPDRWYWVKRAVFSILFHWRARKRKQASSATKERDFREMSRGLGRSMDSLDMERCQPLPDHPHAVDCVYIGAYSSDGPNLVLRVARRPGRRAEVWLFLQVPGVGCLRHPVHPDTTITNADPNSFSAGGLRFDVVHPMKTWRVSFCGQLRLGPCNTTEDKPDILLNTKFSFQWDAFAPHFNYDCDLDPSLLGDGIAREKWSREYFEKLQRKHQTHYEQWGELKGTLSIEGHSTQQLRLKAVRDHTFGVRKWTDFYRYICCFLYVENGVTLQVSVVSQPGMISHFKAGGLTYPTGEMVPVTAVDLNLWELGEDPQQPPAQWAFTFVADGIEYELQVVTKTSAILYHEDDRGGVVHEIFCDVTLNGRKGWGLAEFFYRNQTKSEMKLEPALPLLAEPAWEEVQTNQQELCLPFTSPACSSSALVGGKGSQLALLTQMSEKEDVAVPPGMCVTLRAFDKQMEECKDLQQVIDKVGNTAVCDPQKLVAVCREASALFCQVAVCSSVQKAVREGLRQVFGDGTESKRVAVRSSAAGEDGHEASSAGQMETFLGVQGEKEIFQALLKCWASAFTYQAVEYRRQHGQAVVTSVGVVIQEMVPAETAGVLFTADPVTNNIGVIVINANFGLGESVVSGKCEPDTITVRRAWDNSMTIEHCQTGSKKTKVTMEDGDGIAEVESSATDSSRCCLTDDVILSLANVGVLTEKYFGSPRDIEWAYAGGRIYLLQARPITTSEQDSEEELIHEFDSAVAGGYEWLTTANVSEMMPDAVTPLTMSTFFVSINKALQCTAEGSGARSQTVDCAKALMSCGNHLFISLIDTSLLCVAISITSKEMMELNLLGETRPDLKEDDMLDYLGRPPPGPLKRSINSLHLLRCLNKGNSMVKMWEKRLKDYTVGEGCHTATELFADIDQHLQDFSDVWLWALVNSAQSGCLGNILLGVITRGSSDCTAEHYGDIALLLSHCRDVCSVEVPSAMQELATLIAEDGLKDVFLSSTNKECVEMLKSAEHPALQQKMETFLQHHGHRCVRESDLHDKSWHLDPTQLIGVLKTILKTGSHRKESKEVKTAQQLLSEIKTPLPYLTRKVLQYLLPKVWAAVASREWGKNVAVKMNDIFKTAYWKLASLMVKEGRLPDEDVLFFLTHYEIGQVLATRSARMVMKAQRRRKVFSKQMALRFPTIMIGHPKPMEVKRRSKADDSGATSTLSGMPVSQGVVGGPARVVLSLTDAHRIQTGDVLVVHYTSVGWSPYFPLIAGLITEIGGLIAHGAVVAREYGIPCIVSLPDATLKIPDGCWVEMDGRAGTVKVLP